MEFTVHLFGLYITMHPWFRKALTVLQSNNKGTDQHTYLNSLIGAFISIALGKVKWLTKHATSTFSRFKLFSVAE